MEYERISYDIQKEFVDIIRIVSTRTGKSQKDIVNLAIKEFINNLPEEAKEKIEQIEI